MLATVLCERCTNVGYQPPPYNLSWELPEYSNTNPPPRRRQTLLGKNISEINIKNQKIHRFYCENGGFLAQENITD